MPVFRWFQMVDDSGVIDVIAACKTLQNYRWYPVWAFQNVPNLRQVDLDGEHWNFCAQTAAANRHRTYQLPFRTHDHSFDSIDYSWIFMIMFCHLLSIYCLFLTCWTGTCRRFAWPLTATRRASQLPARFKGAVIDVIWCDVSDVHVSCIIDYHHPVFIPAGPSMAIDVRTSSTSWRASISMAGLSVGQSYRLGKIWNCVAISCNICNYNSRKNHVQMRNDTYGSRPKTHARLLVSEWHLQIWMCVFCCSGERPRKRGVRVAKGLNTTIYKYISYR